ncbi:MAG: hypothetical protein KDJ36_11515, partial [Hyphomicrobiaceae bacterium]|nr:hypothetical protein [Hyphomicrobiaceae bacterium]
MPTANDTERLVVMLEARLTDFERNMLKASGVSRKNFDKIRKDSASATRNMERDMARATGRIQSMLGGIVGNFGKGLFAGVAAGGLAGIVKGFADVADSIASIRDEADKAGLTTKAFQE